ncbi:MAG: ribosomal L7Ae/L30e/S12e/Gadd45 family protein [Lachnospiraceae bacterium]|nr:ribosomal L7Ae/L30e/S12e/Gadd45 family protein [Lachnospiraceae bacterium]
MNQDRAYMLLGLAKRAGRIAAGEFMTEKSVKGGRSALCIVAKDASDNTKKNFKDMCDYYEVDYAEYGDKDGLGHATGTQMRASVSVNDEGFAKKLKEILAENSAQDKKD